MIETKSLKLNNKNGVLYFTFPSLETEGVKHGFSTKIGGVSEGIFESMNLSFSRGDDDEKVLENYKRICSAIGTDYKKCVLSKQTHTTNIRIVTEEDAGKGILKERDYDDVDGLITNVPGLTLVTQYADCVGLMFYDPKKRVIAASHAGWRGTVGMIGQKTVNQMVENFGSNPKDIKAAICPSIGPCCFEVDAPVFEEFLKLPFNDKESYIKEDGNGKYHINLWEANLKTLLLAGLEEENISVTDVCTMCNHEHLFSHRKTQGKRGNLAALICLTERK